MFSHEEYDALQGRAGFLDRSRRGRLRLTGADRRAYLHGLLTNDIARLTQGTGCYAALLTPQGRMISDLRVSELGEAVLLELPDSTVEAVRQRLADFIFTEDVEVHDDTAALGQIGVYGPQAAGVLAGMLSGGGSELRERLSRLSIDDNASERFGTAYVVLVASDDYGVPGFEVFTDAERIDELKGALRDAGTSAIAAETADVTRVEAGRPEFGIDMDEHTIPLEAGIEDRAISLTKGCYVGQEIIIRVLHRGQGRVARHLVGLVGEEGMERGEKLQRDGRDVGTVTSAVVSPKLRRPIALGYVQRDHAAPGTVLQISRESAVELCRVAVTTIPFAASAVG